MSDQWHIRGAVTSDSVEVEPPFIVPGDWTLDELSALIERFGDAVGKPRIIHCERSTVGEKPKPRPKAVK